LDAFAAAAQEENKTRFAAESVGRKQKPQQFGSAASGHPDKAAL